MAKTQSSAPFVANHDHARCIDRAVHTAEQLCQHNDLRFTGIRRRVLELVWANHEPVSAYELLKELRREKDNAEPPTVYRALEFLMQHNLVHRIESLNAFVGCNHPQNAHSCQFMICSQCNQVAEIQDPNLIDTAITAQARKMGFAVQSRTIEIVGTCPACQ